MRTLRRLTCKVRVVSAGCGVNALSGLRMAQESVGLISVAHQAFVTIAGCGVNALSGLRVAQEFVGLISVAHQAIWHWS
ncbi:TPA: hypothetical protein N2Y82_002190 [Escherichia coli]|uniref:hypothetical protein n=2 Tax=Escherichia coli TaxID=562 RepID=UPI0010CBFCE9|nr:hypothetical protein [Escherichia coli]ELJ0537257.1 hypothetical protein [Escherichia coli O36]EFI3847676.1 hypothetical protein [Escherichia coli]EHJ0095794.1 hypothetical protein [Escherichia coli]EIA6554243.1 hypothetical protein [Escherichia coli]